MKKIYFLIALMISFTSYGQDMVITGAFDGPLPGGTPKLVEIYVINDIADLSTFGLGSANNGGGTDGQELTFTGSATAGDFIYAAYEGAGGSANPGSTNAYFGITPDYIDGALSINGDDAIELFSGGAVIDTFGTIDCDPNASGTTCPEWEHTDGWAYRNNSTGPDGSTFVLGSWSFSGPNAVDGCTTNAGCASVFPIGTFTYGGTPCGISLGAATYDCGGEGQIGDNNDAVTINIPYTGVDDTVVVSLTSGGTLGGSDPAVDTDGTISITDLMEGDAWGIEILTGNCTGTSLSGTVPADECDPEPNTCVDISGEDLFESVTVTPNTDMDEWTYSGGTYTMNGYCGGGCVESVETWLILGPLDISSITSDLTLAFTAAESFGDTDLLVNYTTTYPGCPSDATWTTLQTINPLTPDSSPFDVEVDLFAIDASEIFIGIQYVDDGVDGYSGWSLSNVAINAFGDCAVLGQQAPSSCVTCELVLGEDTVTCDDNTENVDTYTATLAFTGGGNDAYQIQTNPMVSNTGDDPSSVASGIMEFQGIPEGTDIIINIVDQGGVCNLERTITSPTCNPPLNCPNPGDIIITEIMYDPDAVGDSVGEFFEVYNATGAAIDMIGWVISDLGSNSFEVEGSVSVAANSYAIFAKNGDSGANGGITADYVFGSGMSLSNSDDEIILSCDGTVIDQVNYGSINGFPDPTGASIEFNAAFLRNNTDNDDGSNWAPATVPYGAGDLGTPGAANTLSNDSFDVDSFKVYPNPNATGILNIATSNNQILQIAVFDLLGKQVINQSIANNRLNVSQLQGGIYVMKITQGSNSVSKKLIIE
ncbi:MAG: T9SS type A sorting domain-containing protein [Flavobacteriaceae bacterium]|nr:T9SS type A sorting domain-containing protein [Flavobacteriaceae bacterium]